MLDSTCWKLWCMKKLVNHLPGRVVDVSNLLEAQCQMGASRSVACTSFETHMQGRHGCQQMFVKAREQELLVSRCDR